MAADSVPGPLAAACPDVGPAGQADGVAGRQPGYLARPASTQEAAAVLRAAASLGLAVLPRGSGARIGWGMPPDRCDLVIDMTRMNGVLEHAAGDLVARVQAGTGLPQLAAALAEAGQRLALDPPAAGAAGGTVGGLVATGVAGPLRLRYGSPRDLLIGITVVRADGAVARAGGKVVKNVAGYDLGKLFAGSYGTLGLITEATFRLHPLPAAATYLTIDCADAGAAGWVMSAAAGSVLAPSAAEIDWPAGEAPIRAGVLLEGDPAGAVQRAERLRELLGDGEVSPQRPSWWGRGAAAEADGTVLRVAFWPGELPGVLTAIRRLAAAVGLDPQVGGSAAAGVLHAAVPERADPAAVARFVTALRAALGDGNGSGPVAATVPVRASAVVLHAPPGVRGGVDMWGPVPSLALMRAVKNEFDPECRMAPGRFAGGI